MTPLGRLLALAATLLFIFAFIFGSVATALGGVALLGFLDAARRTIRADGVTATREAPAIVRVGDPFEVTATARAGSGAPVMPRAELPEGLELLDVSHATGNPGHLRQKVRTTAPGDLQFSSLRVDVEDVWGLWTYPLSAPAPARVRVAAEAEFAEHGRRTGRRHTVQTAVPDPDVAEQLPEVRAVRPYQPGDRARDIDWGITSRLGALHVREREHAAPRKFVVFLDATRSMRRPGRVPKIRTATRIALGITGAAHGAGVHASLVAFHENGIATAGDAGRRAAITEIMDRILQLPPVEGSDAIRLTTDLDRTPTHDERRFLQLVTPFVGPGAAAPTLDTGLAALQRVAGGRAFIVMILDGEVNPRRVEVAASRAQRLGHDVCVIIPATGPHHVDRRSGLAVAQDLEEALRRRKALALKLKAMRIPCLVARPDEEDDIIREVARLAV